MLWEESLRICLMSIFIYGATVSPTRNVKNVCGRRKRPRNGQLFFLKARSRMLNLSPLLLRKSVLHLRSFLLPRSRNVSQFFLRPSWSSSGRLKFQLIPRIRSPAFCCWFFRNWFWTVHSEDSSVQSASQGPPLPLKPALKKVVYSEDLNSGSP